MKHRPPDIFKIIIRPIIRPHLHYGDILYDQPNDATKREISYNTRNRNQSLLHCRTESFKNSYFPYTIEAWCSLDQSIINSNSLDVFKSKLLVFIRPVQRTVYNMFNPQGSSLNYAWK